MLRAIAKTGLSLLLLASLIVGWRALVGGDPPAASKPLVADYPTTIPANNPVTLQLQADDRAVHGWISGTASHAGKMVRIALDKDTTEVTVGDDNTFRWVYPEFKKPVTVDFALGELKASIALSPATKSLPSAYFVVDRTAYRPGQTLQFAAYLRSEDAQGEFVPIVNSEVEVQIVSRGKGLVAGRLNLRSDDFGRVAGSYAFTDADALDDYDLQIPNYAGSANVLLAEYRKSKVRLKITGTPLDGQMKLKFEALDFLDKPVAFGGGSYTAQVVRRDATKATTALKAEEFVHHERRAIPRLEFDDISEDDLLFHEAESANGLFFSHNGRDVVTEIVGELKPSGEASIELKPEWTKGGYELVVVGVVTDATGREQKATETIPIAAKAGEAKKSLELRLMRTRFQPRDVIEVRAVGGLFEKQTVPGATLLVMKLAYQTPSSSFFGKPADDGFAPSGKLPAFGKPEKPQAEHKLEIVRRTLVTAVPFAADAAKVALAEPGAYALIAVVPNADGTSTRAERTVLVKRIEDVNPFTMTLDKSEFNHGERLTGLVRSRFADARALLTLRDSRGILFTKPIQFRRGVYQLNEELPAGLRYGCTLDVAYPEDAGTTRLAHAVARVVPTDRLLKVNVKAPDQVAPGSTVTLDLQVDRKEPVDLIVSVYDRSLLAIKPDDGRDIRSFYHADGRATHKLDRELLRKRLGGVRMNTLLEKVKAIATDPKTTRERKMVLMRVIEEHGVNHTVSAGNLAILLQLAGLDVFYSAESNETGWAYYFAFTNPSERESNPYLADLMLNQSSENRLGFHFVGNTLLIHDYFYDDIDDLAATAWHPAFGRPSWLGSNSGTIPRGWRRGGFGGFGGGGFGGGGFGVAGLPGGGTANNLGAGGGVAGFGGNIGAGGPDPISPLESTPPAIAASPETGEDLGQLPDLAAGVAIRRNFADTAYWNAKLRTDDTGRAQVSFKLPDTLTGWQVVVTAVSKKMHVGGATATVRTFQPVMVWPMLPRTFTEGDSVLVFASVHNRTDAAQKIRVLLKADNGAIRSPAEQTVTIGPKSNAPVYWTFAPKTPGEANLLMTATCDAGADAALKRIPVTRCAAEQFTTVSGFVRDKIAIDIPPHDPTAAQLEITVSPSLVGDLSDSLGYLVEYPYGCVEQTMSRFLPAIKVSQILKTHGVKNAELEKKLPGVAAAGIKRLLELQQNDGSWGWLGSTNASALMSAYALYGLLQAKEAGYTVPDGAITNGGNRLAKFIEDFGETAPSDRIYCLAVHAQRVTIGEPRWKWIEDRAKENKLSDYALALALDIAVRGEKPELAKRCAEALRARAKLEDGTAHWTTAGFSRWADDRFEVTAAALKALVAYDANDPLVEKALAFFAATKRGNRWNSTKDTAMILFAMCDYLAKAKVREPKPGDLEIAVNGRSRTMKLDGAFAQTLVIPASELKAGPTELRMATQMKGAMVRAVFRHWKSGRDIAPAGHGLGVERTYSLVNEKGTVLRELKSGDAVPRGSFIRSEVVTKSRDAGAARYLLVENPKPSGCEVIAKDDKRFEKLAVWSYNQREDRDTKVSFLYEYAGDVARDHCVFLAELAGEFVVAPASAELMYSPLVRGHSGAFVLRVTD